MRDSRPLTPERLAVAIVGADGLVRAALAVRLRDLGFDVASESSRASLDADVIAWDAGISAAALDDLSDAAEGGVPIVALIPDPEPAAQALGAGAHGVLFRDADDEQLSSALRAAVAGLVSVDESLVSHLVRPSPEGAADLTPREVEVLQLLAEGESNKQLAIRLGISTHTAKFHVNAVLTKLDARTRTEAVVKASRAGLLVL